MLVHAFMHTHATPLHKTHTQTCRHTSAHIRTLLLPHMPTHTFCCLGCCRRLFLFKPSIHSLGQGLMVHLLCFKFSMFGKQQLKEKGEIC